MVKVILTAVGEPFNRNVGRHFSGVDPDTLLNKILGALHNSCVDIGRRRTYLGCHSSSNAVKYGAEVSWRDLMGQNVDDHARSYLCLEWKEWRGSSRDRSCARADSGMPCPWERTEKVSGVHEFTAISPGRDLRHTSKEIFKPLSQTAKRTKRWFLL